LILREAYSASALRRHPLRRLIGRPGWLDGMMLALDQAGAQYSQSPLTADNGR